MRTASALTALLAALLVGCEGVQSPAIPQAQSANAHRVSGSSGDLLYTSASALTRDADMAVFTFPQGEPVATISGVGELDGICSDESGNVFAVTELNFQGGIYEFAHGGTTPIAQIAIPDNALSIDCAVDPRTNDLALVRDAGPGEYYIDVWVYVSGQYLQSPTQYPMTQFLPWTLTYDSAGNLFVAGTTTPPEYFALEELPRGKSAFKTITFNQPAEGPSAIAWDGKHLALDTGGRKFRQRIYQFKVSGSKAIVLKTRHFAAMVKQPYNMWISGDTVVGEILDTHKHGEALGFWHYPSGGQPYETLAEYFGPATVSVPPSH